MYLRFPDWISQKRHAPGNTIEFWPSIGAVKMPQVALD
jgi:hypothetical protein